LSEKLVHNISCYIDENYVSNYNQEVYGGIEERERIDRYRLARLMAQREERSANLCADASHSTTAVTQSSQSLSDFIKSKDAGFSETLKALIEKSGQKNSTIYSKANMSKQHFSKIINEKKDSDGEITFVIGGSWGIFNEIKSKANLKLSFSDMTFPHTLFRVMLVEQIYRGFMIGADSKYHK
jgi:23S rRNA (pseudouridine1915-N3)-methyltransferase